MLSNTCKYGVRAVIYLALHDDGVNRIGIKKISGDLKIPSPFLGKILQSLAKNKLLVSTKGPHGGFGLGKPAMDISLYDIVKIIDGDEVFEECLLGLKICKSDPSKQKLCPVHNTSHPIRDGLRDMFKGMSIGYLAENLEKVEDMIDI